eukprot:1233127-Rhodomonas_salina.2
MRRHSLYLCRSLSLSLAHSLASPTSHRTHTAGDRTRRTDRLWDTRAQPETGPEKHSSHQTTKDADAFRVARPRSSAISSKCDLPQIEGYGSQPGGRAQRCPGLSVGWVRGVWCVQRSVFDQEESEEELRQSG